MWFAECFRITFRYCNSLWNKYPVYVSANGDDNEQQGPGKVALPRSRIRRRGRSKWEPELEHVNVDGPEIVITQPSSRPFHDNDNDGRYGSSGKL